MRKIGALAAVAALIASGAAAQVQAPQPQGAFARCGPHDAMANMLEEKYDEYPGSPFVATTGIAHEFFASPAGTWTVLVNLPDGISCAVATGEGKSLGSMPGVGRPM
jgi:hypothetical protein